MAQVLILTENQTVNNVIQTSLEDNYGSEVLVRNSVSEGLSLLELLPTISLVICKDKLAPKITDYLKKNSEHFETEVNLVILGEMQTDYARLSLIPNKANVQKVVSHLGYILGKEEHPQSFEEELRPPPPPVVEEAPVAEPTPAPVEEEEDAGEKTTVFRSPLLEKKPPAVKKTSDPTGGPFYVAISMKYFLSLNEANFDFNLFSRVKKGEEFEYNIKINKGSKVTRTEIDRMLIRGGRELYVIQEDYKKANEILSSAFLARFKAQVSIQERMQLNSDAYEILLEVFKNSTIDKYSVEIIKETLKSMDLLLNSPSPFEAFLVGIKNLKNLSYGYIHSYMGCLLLLSIMDKFPWSKDQSRNKILYLALFHDLALHSDRLIKAHHSPAERAKLSEDDLAVVNNHADAAATILESIIKSSKDVPAIVREHHGMRSGKGFLDSLSLGITPLTMAYIVVEDFVTRYLEKNEKEEVTKELRAVILEELKNKYVKLTYADIAAELSNFFKDR